MKKFLATIALLVYFAGSSGATITVHFCMGELSSWGIDVPSSKACDRCGMQKKDNHGCCHDEHATIQTSKDYQVPLMAFDLNPAKWLPAFPPVPVIAELAPAQPRQPVALSHAPPLFPGQIPVYLSCSVFLI